MQAAMGHPTAAPPKQGLHNLTETPITVGTTIANAPHAVRHTTMAIVRNADILTLIRDGWAKTINFEF